MTTPRDTATTYFDAWKRKDFDTLSSILADGVTFRGPLGAADGADDCLAGLKRMSESMSDLKVLKMADNGNDVLTWFDLYLGDAPPAATVNWQHIEDGKIVRIRVTFDPRAILEHQPAA
jgi:limonene-1,2-epoxide hydrolase